jgi:hypothetical protein
MIEASISKAVRLGKFCLQELHVHIKFCNVSSDNASAICFETLLQSRQKSSSHIPHVTARLLSDIVAPVCREKLEGKMYVLTFNKQGNLFINPKQGKPV